MARKSSEALSVKPTMSVQPNLDPPGTLCEEEKAVWRTVVASKPMDWFEADTALLLVEYCRAFVASERVGRLFDKALAEGDAQAMNTYSNIRHRESNRFKAFATQMRLTNQSRLEATVANTKAKNGTPEKVWHFGKTD